MNSAYLEQISRARTLSGVGPTLVAMPRRRITRWVYLAVSIALLILGVGHLVLQLMGFQYISVRGESMEPTISTGSWLLARPTAPEDIWIGDVIAIPGTSAGMPDMVHRVVGIVDDGDSTVAITMGDNNTMPDPDPLTLEKPVGRIVLILPYLGWLMTPGVVGPLAIICVLLWVKTAIHYRAVPTRLMGMKASEQM